MTVTRNKLGMASSFLLTALIVGIVTSVPVRAEISNATGNGHHEVARQLSSFKQTAFDMQKNADILNSMAPSRQLDWRSHAESLETLKQQVNQLGQTLANLEELRPQANEGQRLAIDSARPPLAATAKQLSHALNLLSENRQTVYRTPYIETVSTLSEHATSLSNTVDTIMNFEKAKVRLSNLDLPTSTGS